MRCAHPVKLGPTIQPRPRGAIHEEYAAVADEPTRSVHFHTGRPLTRMVGYESEWLERIPDTAVSSFAGTGNPFSIGALRPDERSSTSAAAPASIARSRPGHAKAARDTGFTSAFHRKGDTLRTPTRLPTASPVAQSKSGEGPSRHASQEVPAGAARASRPRFLR